jgi:hypothetical protein
MRIDLRQQKATTESNLTAMNGGFEVLKVCVEQRMNSCCGEKESKVAALKRFSIALALVAFAFSSIPSAQAQVGFPVQPLGRIVCTYSAVPNQVRSEGLAERTGDVRLDCTNDGVFNPDSPFNQIQQYVLANITVQLNTAVTNMLDVGGDGGNVTDAVLVINDNNNIRPVAGSYFPIPLWPFPPPGEIQCTNLELHPGLPHVVDPRYPCPQKGALSGSNSLTWDGVHFPVPGAPNLPAYALPDDIDDDGVPDCLSSSLFEEIDDEDEYADICFQQTTTIRITNIRANAAAVGAGGAIFANLTIFSFAGISVTPSNQQTVANVFQGLTVDFGDGVTGLQCEEYEDDTYIVLEEGFAGAFKTLGGPTYAQADAGAENGYPVCDFDIPVEPPPDGPFPSPPFQIFGGGCHDPQSNAGTGGGATQATRFLIRFFGIPAGIEIKVFDAVEGDGSDSEPLEEDCPVEGSGGDRYLCVERVAGADEDGAGGAAAGGGGDYEVGLDSDGNGYVVYELKNGDPFRPQSIYIPIGIWWEPDTGEDEPAIGSGQINATFAPLSDEGEAGNFPKPRFIDTGGDPETFVTVVRCSTTLLFPFVTGRFGFDTGFSISNTSMDWKGTEPQRGRCMIHYIGDTGGVDDSMPDDDLSSIIDGGEQATWTLSMGNPAWELNGAPDFQGFVVAMCEFQYAHGYAFITDATSGVPNFAQGYLALVMQFDSDGDRQINCYSRCRSEGLNQ